MMCPSESLIIIPARWASTRFPGKPLTLIAGADGIQKPLIEHVWRAAAQTGSDVIVATDDQRIADVAVAFGGRVVMTPSTARNGTERCWHVLETLDHVPHLVINWQGDAPLIPPGYVDALVQRWRDTAAPVITPYIECSPALERLILAEAEQGRVGGTTVVADAQDRALYFSKRALPYRTGGIPRLRLHIGIYAYTPEALRTYAATPLSALEDAEGLEQLRFLNAGIPVQLVAVDEAPGSIWEVNNPEDVAHVEQRLALAAR